MSENLQTIPDSDADRPLWGARAIAMEINRPTRAIFHMLENGLLPAKKIGGIWVSTPRKLRQHLGIEAI
jgi:hypothetical protein